MRHRNSKKILDRAKSPRELMLRNLASSIILYEKVVTTKAKAKTVKPLLEKMISISKKGDLNARRALLGVLLQKQAVNKSLEVLAKRYENRPGGYTRITKISNRLGDGAEMVQIELV